MRGVWQQCISLSKPLLARIKPYLRWLILGATLFFLASTLKQHWSEVTALRVGKTGGLALALAFAVTLLAHVWSGWVWSWILRAFNQPATATWGILVYLQTNIAKYLPGNVWHLYGRVVAARQAGFSAAAATLSVLLEPLLMAAAALAIALATQPSDHPLLQLLGLAIVLLAIHPRILNALLTLVGRLKGKSKEIDAEAAEPNPALEAQFAPPPAAASHGLKRYPILPLLGETLFVALRGTGFLFTLLALGPVLPTQLPAVFSAFSIAWVLGLVVPGAPGGIGIFEATAIALLNTQLPTATILGSVALYRLISTSAEAIGAALAWLIQRRLTQ